MIIPIINIPPDNITGGIGYLYKANAPPKIMNVPINVNKVSIISII